MSIDNTRSDGWSDGCDLSPAACSAVDEHVGLLRPFVPMAVGAEPYIALKAHAAGAFWKAFPELIVATYGYTERAMDSERLMRTKLEELPSADFEGVLHPVFEEDEWKLILIGGLLGLAVGVFQSVIIFAGA